MLITITVTEDHISHGVIGQCRTCPIARAISEVLPDLIVQVGISSVSITRTENEANRYIPLPRPVWDFIRAFDNFANMKPISFPLDLPEDLIPFLKGASSAEHHI